MKVNEYWKKMLTSLPNLLSALQLPAREFVTDAQDTMIPMELQTLEVTWPRSHIKLFPIGKVCVSTLLPIFIMKCNV